MGADRIAVIAGLFAGMCYGVFWLPVRAIAEAGFNGPWAMFLLSALPLVACVPIIWVHRQDYLTGPLRDLSGGLIGGIAFALYTTAFLYTDVVRVILLFYTTPAWGFLLGWLVLGDRVNWYRWVAIFVAFLGLYVLFGRDTGLPVPHNFGDWAALVSGFFWAVAAVLILKYQRVSYWTHGVNFIASGMMIALLMGMVAGVQGLVAFPDWSLLGPVISWAFPVAVLLVIPATVATVYTPTRLNPGVVGLLFMTEIVVGAISAAIWADEPMGVREILGLVLILGAGLIEPLYQTLRRKVPA